MYNVVSLRVVPLRKSLVRLEGNYTHQIIRIMLTPNNQQQILDYEVINRLVEMSTQGKGINSYMSQSIQKLKQDLKECKREQQNSKWREKIELLLEKLNDGDVPILEKSE